jgi:hypothetical protein
VGVVLEPPWPDRRIGVGRGQWTRPDHRLRALSTRIFECRHPAGRKFHDGYWINRFNRLVDDAEGAKNIETPNGSRADAWKALTEGNRRIDEYDRKQAANPGKKPR